MGLGRLELPTSRLSSARSNQLSYKPDHARSQGPRHTRKNPTGSSLVEERETKTAAFRKIGLTGRYVPSVSIAHPERDTSEETSLERR